MRFAFSSGALAAPHTSSALAVAVVTAVTVTLTLTLTLGASGCFRASCKPQQVNGIQGQCFGRQGFVWNGSSCVWGRACNCTGPDCDSVYASEDACGAAHIQCR